MIVVKTQNFQTHRQNLKLGSYSLWLTHCCTLIWTGIFICHEIYILFFKFFSEEERDALYRKFDAVFRTRYIMPF